MNTIRNSAGWLACLGSVVVLTIGTRAWGQREGATQPQPAPKTIAVSLNESRTITPPWPVKRVAVTNPAIADVQVLNPRLVLVQAKGVGVTDLLMWSENEQVRQTRIDVDMDVQHLGQDLQTLFPDSRLHVRQTRDVLTVSGKLRGPSRPSNCTGSLLPKDSSLLT